MSGGTVVRAATASDHLPLLALMRRASLANPGDRGLLLARPELLTLPVSQLTPESATVAELGGRLAGFAVVVRRDDGDADLDGLFVEPELWRRRIGSALVEAAAELGRAMQARVLHVIGNPHAEGFYRAVGFMASGWVALEFGDGLRMQLPL
jgi:GNAT superfamily N-acetyltransferase